MFEGKRVGLLAGGSVNRASLPEWHGDPVHRAWCVGSQKLDGRRFLSTHAWNKTNLYIEK